MIHEMLAVGSEEGVMWYGSVAVLLYTHRQAFAKAGMHNTKQ